MGADCYDRTCFRPSSIQGNGTLYKTGRHGCGLRRFAPRRLGLVFSQISPVPIPRLYRKLPRVPLKGIVPVPAPHRLRKIAPASQPTGPPLTNDMEVLVQNQFRVAHELRTIDREQNSIGPSRRTHAQVRPCVSRVLYDDNAADWFAKYALERLLHRRRQLIATTEERAPPLLCCGIVTQWLTVSCNPIPRIQRF